MLGCGENFTFAWASNASSSPLPYPSSPGLSRGLNARSHPLESINQADLIQHNLCEGSHLTLTPVLWTTTWTTHSVHSDKTNPYPHPLQTATKPNATRHEHKSLMLIAQTFNGSRFATRGLRTLLVDLAAGAEVTTTTDRSHQPKTHNLNVSAGSAPVR